MNKNKMLNPLLNWQDLPQFDLVKPELLAEAIDAGILQASKAIKEAEQSTIINWSTVIDNISVEMNALSYAWNIAHHFSGVKDSPEWRDAIDEQIEKVTNFWSAFGQNQILYKNTKELFEKAKIAIKENNQTILDELGITKTRFKVLEDSILGFKLGGAELEGEDKISYTNLQNEQAILCKNISDNVLDANDRFKYIVKAEDKHLLSGIPDNLIQSLLQEDGSYKIGLQHSIFSQVLQFCDTREIREALYKASITRACEMTEYSQGEQKWDNTDNIHKLLQVRQKIAKLLGYDNYAQVSLATKMANQPEKVIKFIDDIAIPAKKLGLQELEVLKEFSASKYNQDLELWDIAYLSEKLRQEQYSYSEQEVSLYFTLSKVLDGMFNLFYKLFAIKIEERVSAVWDKDIKFYAIVNKDNQDIAYFYLDLFTKSGKHSGAWVSGVRNKSIGNANQQTDLPIAFVICNFNKSADKNKDTCITHNDLITLFHEFGHALHHMLTKVTDSGAAGMDGVEWDAVELPSQFLENFCWDYEIIKTLTKHIETNEVMPHELFNKILNAKNFLIGIYTLRQLTFSMLDMQAHMLANVTDITKLSKQIHENYHVLPQLDISRWANTFTHVFAGGYSAGYYSYHWAEVLSSDVFAAFEEEKQKTGTILNLNVGNKYLHEILEVGGSRPAMASFIAFRNREPDINAFLRHNGLIIN